MLGRRYEPVPVDIFAGHTLTNEYSGESVAGGTGAGDR